MCKIPGCTKRYTDPSSLRKHVKTVHGPEAHVTKKQRSDAPPRLQPPKGNENEANSKLSAKGVDGKIEANSTSRGVEDCLQVKSIKTENSMVGPDHINKKNHSTHTFLCIHNKMFVFRKSIVFKLNFWGFINCILEEINHFQHFRLSVPLVNIKVNIIAWLCMFRKQQRERH